MFWKRYGGIIKNLSAFAISALLLYYVFTYLVGWDEIAQSIKSVSYVFIILSFGLAMLSYLVENFKFWLFAKTCGRISLFKLFPIFMAGMLFNAITPGARSGGEYIRGSYLSKENGSDKYKAIAASYASSATYALAFFVFALVSTGIVLFLVEIPTELTVALSVIAVIAVAVAIIIWFVFKKHHLLAQSSLADIMLKIAYWIAKRHKYETYELFKASVVMNFSKFIQSWGELFTNKKLFLTAIAIDIVAILIGYVKVFFIFLAFGHYVNPLIVVAVTSVAQLIGFFLILPGGIGVTEASMIPLYIAFGILPGVSAAVTLVDRSTYYIATYGIGGACYAWISLKHNIFDHSVRLIKRLSRKESPPRK